ncbi:PTS sugar transporter subunit IIA [Terrisporobacter mayombei]|uniref:PTS system glucoside-specific EIICBA component n=1 Tax=Terrisporobacter mayombei TaxID=1541 RepID=A0ABY9PYF1_9FIRM|nr:PTS glucose transporter subunit IIA [Terrisporobacter mayombei]MCC3868099.1 PTS glucose transporter subunit IIA [Terrisporobacter mayombei]WMT80239.1 PTS system glucoside-specific EIICBA component [Terrisporobacter mayombei]
MFGLFSRKKKNDTQSVKGFYAIMDGTSIDLSDVNDDMFSNRMLGDGIATKPSSNIVVAPCNGEVTLVSDTKHAIGLKNEDGIEVLIHIGLDTVKLNGEGFETLCKTGDKIKVGQHLVNVNRQLLKDKNIEDVTMMVVVEQNGYGLSNYHTNKSVEAGKSILIEYK